MRKHFPEILLVAVALFFGVAFAKVSGGPDIDPRLIHVAEDLCNTNLGPKVITPKAWFADRYDVRCTNGALFDNVTIKLEPAKTTLGGAQIPEGK